MVQNATDVGGGGSDFPSPTYRNLAEQVAAKRMAAWRFDAWADTADNLRRTAKALEEDKELSQWASM